MIMSSPRFALRLLAYAESFGVREEVIGDLMEEIGRGRPPLWLWEQLIGLYASAFVAHARRRVRISPAAVAFALCVVLFAGISSSTFSGILEAWLTLYYVTGTLSLFADLSSRIADARPRFTSAVPE
jgi:peptidoglycan/LPS O-acetylase OafA/YrhL